MANLYFDVRHLPRHLKNQKDFEVFMSFSDQLLRLRQQRDLNKAELSTDNASKHIDGDELESVDDGTAKRDIDEHSGSHVLDSLLSIAFVLILLFSRPRQHC